MTDFYRLTEHNHSEGETWLYYFPVNEKVGHALDIASTFIDEIEFDSNLVLVEEDVDFIIDHLSGLGSYKSLANKVTVNSEKAKELIILTANINYAASNEYDEDVEELRENILDILYKGTLFDE